MPSRSLAGAALVTLCIGAFASDADVLAELRAFETQFAQFKQESALHMEQLRAKSAQRQAVLQERLRQMEQAAEHRRLHTTQQEQIDYNTGNHTGNAEAIANLQSATNHTWLILCGALVMFMQAGFAMVESGCCRAKNVQNILMKNLVDVCIGTMCWWAVGWTLAYGIADEPNNAFAGDKQFFGMGFTEADANGNFTTSRYMLDWFFQWAFCSAAATIVSGGVAERVQFPGYLVFTIVMTSWIYPVVVHWTWGYGWLAGGEDYSINDTGFMDFAGSGIVHMCGGIGALVGAAVVGPRNGRFDPESPKDAFAPHSLPLIVLGTFILWFGWYGFNCGSTLGMASDAQGTMAAQVAMNTTLSAATCGLTVLMLRFAVLQRYDIGGMCNGILAGLVSITAPCGNVECGSAILTGFIGAFIYQGSSMLLQKLKVDDPIDAFAVHGACGAWGVLAAALFDWGKGVDYFNGWSGWSCVQDDNGCVSGAFKQALEANLMEIFIIAVWTAFFSLLVFVPLRFAGFLRADAETQDQGMDARKHSPSKAYAMDAQLAPPEREMPEETI